MMYKAVKPSTRQPRRCGILGFTAIEVLVALAIVSVALLAGFYATSGLTLHETRQSTLWLARLCADNALAELRLSPQHPQPGVQTQPCSQADLTFSITLEVRPSPNPALYRVFFSIADPTSPNAPSLLRASTVLTR